MLSLFTQLLPLLSANGQLPQWIRFNKLLAHQNFPTNNIAYLLFLDIVDFFSSDTAFSMRYNDQTKQFWTLGYKLFKGKFIRFMGVKKYLVDQKKLNRFRQ